MFNNLDALTGVLCVYMSMYFSVNVSKSIEIRFYLTHGWNKKYAFTQEGVGCGGSSNVNRLKTMVA